MKAIQTCVIGGLLGGIVLFIWGSVSWMVLPWHNATIKSFKYDVAVEQSILANTDGAGLYLLPNCHSQDHKKANQPFGFFVFSPQGYGSMTKGMVYYFLIEVLGAFLVTCLLIYANISTYRLKVAFIILLAVAMGVICKLPDWNWWKFPLDFVLVNIADLVIGWFLAGLVIAKIVK